MLANSVEYESLFFSHIATKHSNTAVTAPKMVQWSLCVKSIAIYSQLHKIHRRVPPGGPWPPHFSKAIIILLLIYIAKLTKYTELFKAEPNVGPPL